MKVLGISFGRKRKSCDTILKQALIGAREAGADVKFINTIDMTIGHCKSCAACVIGRDRGGQIHCAVKDDYQILEEAMIEADAILVAAPVYALGPVGQLKNLIDRFGPAHDIAGMTAEQEKRKENGTPLLDERLFKRKYVGYISVGGAITHNWVSMGLPGFKMFGASTCWIPVGQMDVHDMGRRGEAVFDTELMETAYGLGKHIVACDGKEMESVEWYGEEGICPVCHNSFISIGTAPDPGKVECPLCGCYGTASMVDGQIKVEFTQEEQDRARGRWAGQQEHYKEICSMVDIAIPKIMAHKDKMPELMKPFDEFVDTY